MLIRILRMPRSFPSGFHFTGPQAVTFFEVDWFRADPPDSPDISTPSGRRMLEDFIKDKHYYHHSEAWLILAGEHSFTINYKAS